MADADNLLRSMADKPTRRQRDILIRLRYEDETTVASLFSWNPERPGDTRRTVEALIKKGWVRWGSKKKGASGRGDISLHTIRLTRAGRTVTDRLRPSRA